MNEKKSMIRNTNTHMNFKTCKFVCFAKEETAHRNSKQKNDPKSEEKVEWRREHKTYEKTEEYLEIETAKNKIKKY